MEGEEFDMVKPVWLPRGFGGAGLADTALSQHTDSRYRKSSTTFPSVRKGQRN